MVSKRDLEGYIKTIPPKPEVIKRVLDAISRSELREAGEIAEADPILKKYLQDLVNKPFYGFRNRVTSLPQIFSILGVNGSQETVSHYLLSLLAPKKWHIFKLNSIVFQNLQATLGFYWRKTLEYENIDSKELSATISLLPATVILCDTIFYKSSDEVALIQDNSDFDFNILLKEITGVSLFELIIFIGKYWGFSPSSLQIIKASANRAKIDDKKILRLGQFMHLILFYVLSKEEFISTGLNGFIKFDIEYVMPIYDDFQKILGDELL